jgi:hypothetical protein
MSNTESTRTRKNIQDDIHSKEIEMNAIGAQIVELKKEAMLLCDKQQRFEEKEELIVTSKRPRRTEKRLIGRVFWDEHFVDEGTGEVITVERSEVVRENGEWISWR